MPVASCFRSRTRTRDCGVNGWDGCDAIIGPSTSRSTSTSTKGGRLETLKSPLGSWGHSPHRPRVRLSRGEPEARCQLLPKSYSYSYSARRAVLVLDHHHSSLTREPIASSTSRSTSSSTTLPLSQRPSASAGDPLSPNPPLDPRPYSYSYSARRAVLVLDQHQAPNPHRPNLQFEYE
jgi:hypothetical protein